MTTNKVLRNLVGHQLDVCGCDFSPDGALLVTSSYDASVVVWDPYVGTMLMQLRYVTGIKIYFQTIWRFVDNFIREMPILMGSAITCINRQL